MKDPTDEWNEAQDTLQEMKMDKYRLQHAGNLPEQSLKDWEKHAGAPYQDLCEHCGERVSWYYMAPGTCPFCLEKMGDE